MAALSYLGGQAGPPEHFAQILVAQLFTQAGRKSMTNRWVVVRVVDQKVVGSYRSRPEAVRAAWKLSVAEGAHVAVKQVGRARLAK